MNYNLNLLNRGAEAFISSRRNRLKSYICGSDTCVYLNDKQEFEIELFNPTQVTKLAKVFINGASLSESGIVIKPGQRIYLERYIDEPKKLTFETYVIDNTPEAKAATINNGEVAVYFYNEMTPSKSLTLNNYDWRLLSQQWDTDHQYFLIGSSSASEVAPSYTTRGTFTSNTNVTGRIEKGKYSDQSFTDYTGIFYSISTNTVTIKLLPSSSKPLEIKDLAIYCTECGTKNKGGKYKFCPKCGTKF